MSQSKCVAIYARVSSEQQAKAQTIDSQIEALKSRIKQDGFSLPEDMYFIDDGYSGSQFVRPALERLRDCVHMGVIDRLYVLCPDRLIRKYAYQVLIIEELTASGMALVFLEQAHGTAAEDILLRQVQGIIAEYERAKIVERNRRGRIHSARQGNVSALSGAPYGYNYIAKQNGQLASYEINLIEAKVIRQIFHWVGIERLTLGEVIRRLESQGIEKKGGNQWDRSAIRRWLNNPAYIGKAAFGKSKTEPMTQRIRPLRHGSATPKRVASTSRRDPAEWIEIPVPAIISESLFQAAQKQMEENRRRARQWKRGATYLLQGLVVCGHCDYAYVGSFSGAKDAQGRRSYGYYRCSGSNKYRHQGHVICDNKPSRIDALDEMVWAQVQVVLKEPQRLQREYQKRLDAFENNDGQKYEQNALEKQIKKLKQGSARLIDGYADGALTLEEFKPRIENLKQKVAQLESQLIDVKNDEEKQNELSLVINHLEQFADTVNKNLSSTDFLIKRTIIRALVKQIEVHKNEIVVIFRVEPSAPTNREDFKPVSHECSKPIDKLGKSKNDSVFSQDCSRLHRGHHG